MKLHNSELSVASQIIAEMQINMEDTRVDDVYTLMRTETHQNMSMNDLVGGGDPKNIGKVALELLSSLQLIRKDSVVFDIGCGCGRTAIEQARFLSEGEYIGFDIVPALINFATKYISSIFENAKFYLSRRGNDLYKDYIVADGDYLEFYEHSARPDLITAFSLFTHFYEDDAVFYLDRMREKLADDGSMCISAFLLNDSSSEGIAKGYSSLTFDTSVGDVVFGDPKSPLSRVAWNESYLRKVLLGLNLEIHSITYGNWSGIQSKYYQDYMVLKKGLEVPKDFDPQRYLDLHPDLRRVGVSPCHHYMNYGRLEGRRYK